MGHPSPHDVHDLRVHGEEIGEALRIIRSEYGHGVVVLNGHPTGGLQTVIRAEDHPGSVEAVTLNSPWLQLNVSGLTHSYGSAYVDVLPRRSPERIIDNPVEVRTRKCARLAVRAVSTQGPDGTGEDDVTPGAGAPVSADAEPAEVDPYVWVLHKRWSGEWGWDLRFKPSPTFPVRAKFLAGVRRPQRKVRHGLGTEVSALVCCSTASGGPEVGTKEALRSDAVPSVEQIVQCSAFFGADVTVRQIPGGVYDLAFSPSPAREEYLTTVIEWLTARLGHALTRMGA